MRVARAKAWVSASGFAIGLLPFAIVKEAAAAGLTGRSTYVGIAALSGMACSLLDRTRGRTGK